VRLSRESSHPSKRKHTFNHKPFRRPWRMSTPSPSRARSRSRSLSRSRPPQQTEPDDQESPGGPDRNFPSFTPGEETEENCDPEQGNMDDNSSDEEDVIEDGSTTSRKAVSLAGKKQEKTCDMEAPSYRFAPAASLPSMCVCVPSLTLIIISMLEPNARSASCVLALLPRVGDA